VLLDRPDACTFFLEWRTRALCINEPAPPFSVTCAALDSSTGQLYDLSSLAQNTTWSALSSDGAQYYFSVCRALTPPVSTLCPFARSGGCMVNGANKTSLGGWFRPYVSNGVLTITYTNVRACVCVCVCVCAFLL
jgi:hypothetical protein